MPQFDDFIQSFRDEILKSIWTGCIARVQTFTREPLEASVVPMLNYPDRLGVETPYAPITLPVNVMWSGNYFIIPDYKPGDLVWLAPNINNFSGSISTGANATLNGSFHGLENMVVAFGIKKDAMKIPTSLPPTGMVIGHMSGESYINVSDSKIEVKAPAVNVVSNSVSIGGQTPTEEGVLGTQLKTVLENLKTILSDLTVADPVSGPVLVSPSVISALSSWSSSLTSILSTAVKLT